MTLDARALDDLYRTHGDVVLRRARAILGSNDAEDVLQEVFASLLKRPEQFRGESSVTTFLYAMTTHLCFNKLRDHRNRARLVELHVAPRAQHTERARGESSAVLRDLLGRVSEELAAVAIYSHVDGMSHEEIAGIMGCSRRHVGDLLERFKAEVQALLKGEAA